MRTRPDGLLLGIAAYGLWGIFPLYWPLLEPAGAVELLAHRMVWTAVVMVALAAAAAVVGAGRKRKTGDSLRNLATLPPQVRGIKNITTGSPSRRRPASQFRAAVTASAAVRPCRSSVG